MISLLKTSPTAALAASKYVLGLEDDVVGVVCETEDEKMQREEEEEEENRCLVTGMEYGIKIKTLDRSVKGWKQCQQFCQNDRPRL